MIQPNMTQTSQTGQTGILSLNLSLHDLTLHLNSSLQFL